MKKTVTPSAKDIKRDWVLIDARGRILGRLAVQIAKILRGKHKPYFTPHLDCGDHVIVINARHIKLTGTKLNTKVYRRHSGYPGGLKETSLRTLMEKNPPKVLRMAVERMVSRKALGKRVMRKLKIYADENHPHTSQNPKLIEV